QVREHDLPARAGVVVQHLPEGLGRVRLVHPRPTNDHIPGELVVGEILDLRLELVLRYVPALDLDLDRLGAGDRNTDLRLEGRIRVELEHQSAYRMKSPIWLKVAVTCMFWSAVIVGSPS